MKLASWAENPRSGVKDPSERWRTEFGTVELPASPLPSALKGRDYNEYTNALYINLAPLALLGGRERVGYHGSGLRPTPLAGAITRRWRS